MKNKIINFDMVEQGNYIISDYKSFDVLGLKEFISNMDDNLFKYYTLAEDDKLERVSYELYGTPDYWDMIILVNNMNPLFCMMHSYDVVYKMTENLVDGYQEKYPKVQINPFHEEYMRSKYQEFCNSNNEANKIIKVVKPEFIYEFIRLIYDEGFIS